MGLGPIPRSAIMNFADECSMNVDEAEKFIGIIRIVDTEFLRSVNSAGDKKGREREIEEVSINDVEGTKQILSRLASRASAARKKPKTNGNS